MLHQKETDMQPIVSLKRLEALKEITVQPIGMQKKTSSCQTEEERSHRIEEDLPERADNEDSSDHLVPPFTCFLPSLDQIKQEDESSPLKIKPEPDPLASNAPPVFRFFEIPLITKIKVETQERCINTDEPSKTTNGTIMQRNTGTKEKCNVPEKIGEVTMRKEVACQCDDLKFDGTELNLGPLEKTGTIENVSDRGKDYENMKDREENEKKQGEQEEESDETVSLAILLHRQNMKNNDPPKNMESRGRRRPKKKSFGEENEKDERKEQEGKNDPPKNMERRGRGRPKKKKFREENEKDERKRMADVTDMPESHSVKKAKSMCVKALVISSEGTSSEDGNKETRKALLPRTADVTDTPENCSVKNNKSMSVKKFVISSEVEDGIESSEEGNKETQKALQPKKADVRDMPENRSVKKDKSMSVKELLISSEGTSSEDGNKETRKAFQPSSRTNSAYIDKLQCRAYVRLVRLKVDENMVPVYSSQLQCKICRISFPNEKALSKHMENYKGYQIQECKCGKAFTSLWFLQSHINCGSNSCGYACDKCGLVIKNVTKINEHKLVHEQLKITANLLCDKYLNPGKRNSLRRKVRDHVYLPLKPSRRDRKRQHRSNKRLNIIDICKTHMVSLPSSLKDGSNSAARGTSVKENGKKKFFSCGFCKLLCNQFFSLKSCKFRAEKGPFQCKKCECIYEDKFDFVCHMRIHKNGIVYKCGCTETFRDVCAYNVHKKHCLLICKKGSRKALVRPRNIHYGFQCKMCLKRFNFQNNLLIHLGTHLKNGVFK